MAEMQALPPGVAPAVRAQAEALRYATDRFALARGILVLVAIGVISRLASLACLLFEARAASAHQRVHRVVGSGSGADAGLTSLSVIHVAVPWQQPQQYVGGAPTLRPPIIAWGESRALSTGKG